MHTMLNSMDTWHKHSSILSLLESASLKHYQTSLEINVIVIFVSDSIAFCWIISKDKDDNTKQTLADIRQNLSASCICHTFCYTNQNKATGTEV